MRALNNEPALMFSAIFGFGILVVPLAGQMSGLVQTELDDDCAVRVCAALKAAHCTGQGSTWVAIPSSYAAPQQRNPCSLP